MEQKTYELTNPQKSIYLLENFYKGSSINNICGTCIIHSVLNFDLLKKAIILLIKNNDSFRLHFELNHNTVRQYFSQLSIDNFDIIDVADMDAVTAIENEMQRKVFNIFSTNNNFEFKIFRFPNNHGGYTINIHHLLADSWALGIVARKIIEYYNLLLNGEITSELGDEAVMIDPSCVSYTDYISDEENYLNSPKFKKDEEYWNSVFEEVPEIATVPSKFNSASSKNTSSAHRSEYTLSNELVSTISTYCQSNGISVYNFLMSVYSLYFSKVCSVSNFVIGTPILNRCNYAQKQTLGMFISTLPVLFNVNFENTFTEYAKKNAINSLTMLRHQKYPYQNILENLRKKQPDIPNLYNILLSYQVTKTNTDGFDYETRWAFNSNCADDIQIHILDINDNGFLNIYYDYKICKFDSQDIEDLHNRILHIIEQVLENSDIKLADIDVVTAEEKYSITEIFNNTTYPYDSSKNIVDLFEAVVSEKPLNTAVICNNKKITYDELNKKSNQLANYLIKKDIRKNDLVGIMVNRSLEMVIGLIAILKIGASYIPIDPSYPKERINYLIENSNSKALLVDNNTCNSIDGSYKINITLDSSFYNTESTSNLNIDIPANSLMYLIYTSGSTGKPKGVMVTHNNFHNFLVGINNVLNLKNYNSILSVTTICFDIFGLELWGGLLNELTVVIANEDEQNNCQLLNSLCMKNDVDIMQTTPSRISAFLRDEQHLSFLKGLRLVLLGGESLQENLVAKLLEKTPAKLFNMYGPTETTVWSTTKEIIADTNISIGTPLCNTTCYILDKNLGLLPPFTPGNLYIGGNGVSKGYYHFPELTLKRFINSPFKEDELLYNTGDLAYYDKNGNIYHLGRNDFQVKIRGYRIELGEIEQRILSFPGIKETAVVANSNSLVAYYTVGEFAAVKESDIAGNLTLEKENNIVDKLASVKKSNIVGKLGSVKDGDIVGNLTPVKEHDIVGNLTSVKEHDTIGKLAPVKESNIVGKLTPVKESDIVGKLTSVKQKNTVGKLTTVKESDIVSYLFETLPDYMIPSEFIKLEKMPLTPNGKLDRNALPKPNKTVRHAETPNTATEKLLARIISTVVKHDVNDVNEPFISMGLDSLGIIQVQTELLSHNVNITTHYFYKYPTIRKLATEIDVAAASYNEQYAKIPAEFQHYPEEILGRISSIDVNENILGNVLLTGSNGFIGIHILHELLHNTNNKIYCLVRGHSSNYRVEKLKSAYKYYFNEDLSEYLESRINIIGGDISYINLNMSITDLENLSVNVNTIINTAANVRHYGNIEDFEKNNIEGTKNIVEFAFKNNIRLIHLSSISVSGNYLVKQDNHNVEFSENDLYIGQHYEDNNYVFSKMEAEKLILKYMEKGLTAKILRIGIVAGRYSDGFFQKKIEENAFYARLKSIIKMHAVSNSMTLQSIEFTPVDLCAKAIVTLAKNSVGDNKVFNVYNHNLVTIFKVLGVMKNLNIDIDILDSMDFNNYVLNLSKNEKDAIKGIINDLSYDKDNLLSINYNFTVNVQSNYTRNYLHLLNFDWPVLDEEYLFKILRHMKDVGFI